MTGMGQDIGAFLVHTLFTIYIVIVMLRVLLALVRADFYNPMSQFIVRATNPVLVPFRRLIPSIGRIDTGAIVLLLLLKLIELALLLMLGGGNFGQSMSVLPLLLFMAVFELIRLLINVYIFALIIQAVLSWVSPGAYGNPMALLLYSLTEPLLRPIRNILPPMGMIDFSPMAAIILLYILQIVLNHAMQGIISGLAGG
ncbi:MAG: YggT family protein [Gammaproteobacteria bacterium]|jgi:YggT family protein